MVVKILVFQSNLTLYLYNGLISKVIYSSKRYVSFLMYIFNLQVNIYVMKLSRVMVF